MAENKQGAHNGAYYGPSIPPSESNQRPSRRGCTGRCLLSVLWKILLALAVLAGLGMLILYLIFQPQEYKIHVTNATLTEFNLANTTTARPNIYYNISLDMAVRNPNKKIIFHFEEMEARVYYKDQRFAAQSYHDFKLEEKTGTILKLSQKGQSLLLMSASGLKEFNEEKAAGVYKIDLKFRPRNFFRLGYFTFGRYKYPKVNCGLKIPLKGSNGTSVASFKTTKCNVKFKHMIPF